ncbi:hypothetical protein Pmani_011316 [Petrolisthes manimaculis]|uniref:Uncharacterized protein n=1 Tax=Petrolisthes manimaculis TaxID=1843537 RepID=A0AAE1PZH0_9EUCA|nr:hypothetical protein Pmani_011316 [Petrolisthes manimaculis]
MIHHSFQHNGTPLFNSIPKNLRNLTSVTVDTFKHKLDKWLATVPDQPPTAQATQAPTTGPPSRTQSQR